MTFEAVDKFLTNPDTLMQIVQNWNKDRVRVNELEAQVEADKPKVIFADAVAISSTTILIGDLAKLLRQNGVEMGQQRLFRWLRENGYLISRRGASWNMPAQRSMEMGLFEIKETVVTHSDGHTTVSKTTKVTGKGQAYFINLFLSRIEDLIMV